jgi:hypothetical protein
MTQELLALPRQQLENGHLLRAQQRRVILQTQQPLQRFRETRDVQCHRGDLFVLLLTAGFDESNVVVDVFAGEQFS